MPSSADGDFKKLVPERISLELFFALSMIEMVVALEFIQRRKVRLITRTTFADV
jgi:hypothetical protein